ncbi:lamin tail domain-containing protein [Fontisphaera persica]|uniref:lamin tail domain-containing protein n=1 Tax=Fontisphaera persica TaxID=2974023 RepID=UPI0024BF5407|nr:lamin tail domain-containing protein [Fontisphaera persica]WCJ60055.1 lamin tail domain-containing protein [Fontisphaera persica]
MAAPLWGQNHRPVEIGTQVNGYQDDFRGTTLAPAWQVQGASVYFASNGVLRVFSASGDPNHLYYAAAGASGNPQEVLARIRLLNLGTGDAVRCGVAVGIEPTAPSQAGGVNFLFRDHTGEGQTGRHVSLLDDLRAWGPGYTGAFNLNTWYWVRLRQEPNAQGGTTDVFARFWRADGSEPEPANWQLTWDYIPARAARSGYAGITASSSGGLAEFEVDYILIKAAGLPSILVNPDAFPAIQLPVSITHQPQDVVVNELQSATLQVQASGFPPLTYRWYKNGQLIPNATQPTLTLPSVPLADNGAEYYVVVANVASNVSYSVTSRVATVQVIPDTTPPALLRVYPHGLNGVRLVFSEPLSEASATYLFNYSLVTTQAETVAIQSAELSEDGAQVLLHTDTMTEGMGYILTMNNLRDRAAANNALPHPMVTNFVAVGLAPMDVEGSSPPGYVEWIPGGYRLTGGHAGNQITQEGGHFAGTQRSGDFDVRVRISRLEANDLWARAGLMARVSEETSQNYAAVFATRSVAGCFFITQQDGQAQTQGRFPVNYPSTWLRLQREENRLSGYVSVDGERWMLLGSATLDLPSILWVGLAVSSHAAQQWAAADFQDFSDVTSYLTVPLSPERESMGPSSRRTGLVISEIMYRPAPHPTITNSLEFVEIANTRGEPEDLSGWRLSGDIDYTFPAGTVIPGGGFLVVARSPQAIQQAYGLTQVLGPFTNNLPNNNGTLRLRHRTGAVMLEVTYDDEPPWPVAADGAGHSLVLARPSYGENSPLAWAASDQLGGSPGSWDPVTPEPLRAVVLNEFMAHSAGVIGRDYVELFNRSSTPLNLAGCTIADATGTNRFTLPPDTIIPGRGWLHFSQFELGFGLSGGGGTLFLRHPDGRVLDAVRYPPQATETAYGRYPDGAPEWQELTAQTPGRANAPILIRDVVINEIMYAPISGDDDDQYIELYNKGTNTLNIGGWAFVDGIEFQFPPQTHLPPNGYVVIAKNVTNLLAKYPQLNASNTFGNFQGSLAAAGERLALAMFEGSLLTNQVAGPRLAPPTSAQIITDPRSTPQAYVVVDEVTYHNGGRWGRWSDRGGSSLELMDPRSDNRLASNWADSDESAKAPWTTISRTGILDLGNVTPDSLQILPLGAGEYVVDDVVVLNASGQNVLPNGQFNSSASGWVAEGALSLSYWAPALGVNNSGGFLIRAVDRGDNQINRLRASLSSALATGAAATLQAKVRWLRGHPEMLLRLRGNWLEAAARLELPANLGTPGLPNSRYTPNAPPAIHSVTHYPIVPAAQQAVRVTARVHDPDGVAVFQLHYRVDPATNYTTLTLRDNGQSGDETAGDGLFSALIPGQANGAVVAFYLTATDAHATPATSRFPANAPGRECVVRFGEPTPPGTFPIYRIWMTQATFTNWSARHKLDNSPNPVTFVLNNERVIYEAEAQFAGSPYIAPGFNTPSGNRCGYSLAFPADDRLFGSRDLVLDWPGGHGGETTAIQEQMAYAMAEGMDLPFSHRHFIRLYVHGVSDMQRGGVFEAVLQPAGEYLEQWSPEQPKGDFYKIDRAFEFNDSGTRVADPMPRLEVYQSGGQKKIERYRWTWLKRSYDSALDYSPLMNLVDALNAATPEPYTTLTERLVDVEQWMGVFAFEHIINNFDSWGHNIGKNMYMFRPHGGGAWVIYPFDLDWLMLVSPRGPGGFTALTGPLFDSEDPTVTRMYNHPPFRRAYFRAVKRTVDGPMRPEIAEPLMDAKYRSLLANGITLCDGQSLTDPGAVKQWYAQRRGFLLGQLAAVSAPFEVATNYLVRSTNYFTLTGKAPIEVTTLTINGVAWKPVWTSVTNWTLNVPGAQPTNHWVIAALDAAGNTIGTPQAITAVFTNPVPPAKGSVVFSEIMYHPAEPEAQYLELHNRTANHTFDLSGWRINGLGYTFPPGSAILPGQYLILAKNREAYGAAYGASHIVFDQNSGNLQTDGETLTLLRPMGNNQEEIVAQMRYEANPPWPADQQNSAIQLRDARQDIRRVINWANHATWQFKSFTVSNVLTFNLTNLYFRFSNAGEVLLDDLRVEEGAVVGGGTNYVVNGDFEAPLEGTWVKGTMVQPTVREGSVSRSGQYSLRLVATGRAQTVGQSLSQPLVLKTATVYTVSYWYLPSATVTSLQVYVTAFVNSNVVVHAPVYARSPGVGAEGCGVAGVAGGVVERGGGGGGGWGGWSCTMGEPGGGFDGVVFGQPVHEPGAVGVSGGDGVGGWGVSGGELWRRGWRGNELAGGFPVGCGDGVGGAGDADGGWAGGVGLSELPGIEGGAELWELSGRPAGVPAGVSLSDAGDDEQPGACAGAGVHQRMDGGQSFCRGRPCRWQL